MKPLRSLAPGIAFAVLATLAVADDNAEPPVTYTLEINGQPHELSPDQPLKIEGDFSNPEVTLRVAKVRTLQAAGITFSYPAHFTYEADTSDPDVQTWTVAGNDVTLILFSFSGEIDPRVLAESTANELEAKKADYEDVSVKLGDGNRAGVKATINLVGQTLIQQTLALPPTAKGSRLLVVQEIRGKGEKEAAELGATLKLIASSLKVKP